MRQSSLTPAQLDYWADWHNRKPEPTRSAHRLVSDLQRPFLEQTVRETLSDISRMVADLRRDHTKEQA